MKLFSVAIVVEVRRRTKTTHKLDQSPNKLLIGNWADAVASINILMIELTGIRNPKLNRVAVVVEVRRRIKHCLKLD